MNIIFGEAVKEIPDSFTVLELDTIQQDSETAPVTFYCVLEKIPLQEFALLEAHKTVHADIIRYYKQREWDYCEKAIEGLVGKWNGELDSFYTNLVERVKTYKETPPDSNWTGILDKSTPGK